MLPVPLPVPVFLASPLPVLVPVLLPSPLPVLVLSPSPCFPCPLTFPVSSTVLAPLPMSIRDVHSDPMMSRPTSAQ